MKAEFAGETCAEGHLRHASLLYSKLCGVSRTPGVKENQVADAFSAGNKLPRDFNGQRTGSAPAADVIRTLRLDGTHRVQASGCALLYSHILGVGIQLAKPVEGEILTQLRGNALV